MPSLGGWELVILLGILVLVFGAKRLPDMARSVGQSARVFKGEMKGLKAEDVPAPGPVVEKVMPLLPAAVSNVMPAVPMSQATVAPTAAPTGHR